jgi:AcrR family transcriptional regulator
MATSRTSSRARDSDATQERLLEAVGRLLARRGFLGLGVNAIAREARVDKVLIYRYFGGLPELLEAFAERGDFWPTVDEAAGASPGATANPHPADAGAAMLKGFLRALRARPTTQEILRWELAAPNELTERLAAVRERRGLEMLRRATGHSPRAAGGADFAAIAAVLSAGLVYLVLRSKSAPEWLGIPLAGEAGWARVERAIDAVVGGALRTEEDRHDPERLHARPRPRDGRRRGDARPRRRRGERGRP